MLVAVAVCMVANSAGAGEGLSSGLRSERARPTRTVEFTGLRPIVRGVAQIKVSREKIRRRGQIRMVQDGVQQPHLQRLDVSKPHTPRYGFAGSTGADFFSGFLIGQLGDSVRAVLK